MKPRFVIGSLTGYNIAAHGARAGSKPMTSWYVLDSRECYRVIKSFHAGPRAWRRGRAQAYADRLNQEYP